MLFKPTSTLYIRWLLHDTVWPADVSAFLPSTFWCPPLLDRFLPNLIFAGRSATRRSPHPADWRRLTVLLNDVVSIAAILMTVRVFVRLDAASTRHGAKTNFGSKRNKTKVGPSAFVTSVCLFAHNENISPDTCYCSSPPEGLTAGCGYVTIFAKERHKL
jgi:hypothetical protein